MHCGQIVRKSGTVFSDLPAVWFDSETLTYGEVYERSCRLVNALRALGVSRQDRVATLGSNALRSLEEIAGLALGGFTRVPLHNRNAADVHCYMLERSEARALLTDPENYEALRGRLDAIPTLEHVIVCGTGGPLDYDELLAAASFDDPQIGIEPDDMLHITFTSGTTGRPKGVVQSHRSWLGVVAENLIMLPPLREEDRFLAVAPLSHAAGSVIFSVMAKGAGTVVVPTFEPARAAELIERHRATFTLMVPTMLHNLVSSPEAARYDLSSLRFVLSVGAPIAERTIRDVVELMGDVLHIGFGQSESMPATLLSAAEIRRGLDEDPTLLRSVGRPVPRAMIKILDDEGTELPPGQQGEIATDAPGNMKELWRDPEGTAARFTEDGFVLTRDIGYLDERGYLFLVDRKEDMIVSGGFNISPAELENAILSHPAVLEVAVVGVPHAELGESPRAVVVLKPGETVGGDELLAWCSERVGPSKAPTSVVFRQEPLPKSAVGKLLRRTVRLSEWPQTDSSVLISGA